jgi:hypothetical protein
MPAKTFLPGAGATSGNFSTLLAEAQDSPDSSVADLLNDRGSNAPKKTSAKIDKSDKSDKANPRPVSAEPDPILPKATIINSAAPSATNLTQKGVPKVDDSDLGWATEKFASDSVVTIPARLASAGASTVAGPIAGAKPTNDDSVPPIVSGAVISGQPGPKQADSPNSVQDSQPTAVSSTNLLSTWMARDEDTSFKSVALPPAANLEASATPNGKPATAGTKTVSTDTARGTTSTPESKTQTGFTFLQSGAPSTVTPPNHVTSDTPKGQQEKSVALASSEAAKSEAHKKELDGAGDGATQLSKGESPSSGPALANSSGAQGGTAASVTTPAVPGPAVSMQMSPPAVDVHSGSAVGSPKTADALPHSQSTPGSEDAEVAAEKAALPVNSALHTAKLVAGIEQSELRVGFRTGEFGNVDIRTSLVRNQFTAEISAERGELGRALAAELPSLQHRLTEQHLPAANITVQDHSSGSSSDFRQGSRPGQSAPAPTGISGHRANQDSIPTVPPEAMEATARLDIHM